MIYFEKTETAPASLATEKEKSSGKYNLRDVLDLLKSDFKNKCYLCESSNITSLNVEHFIPHQGDVNLKFDWQNLFYACSHCNNTKLDIHSDILNCTDPNAGVDTNIKYTMQPFPTAEVEITAIVNDTTVNNTVTLLKEIYNGTTQTKKIEASNIRRNILLEIRNFQKKLDDYFDERNTFEEKESFEREIAKMLRDASPFTAFKKWIIWSIPGLNNIFGKYI